MNQQIKGPINKHFKDFLTKSNNQFTFFLNEEFVGQIFDKLVKTSFPIGEVASLQINHQRVGSDGISSKLLKTNKDAVIKSIIIIMNQMIITGLLQIS